jgi:hypothetical protein
VITDFAKAAVKLAEQAQELDRRFAEKQVEHDALSDLIAKRKGELAHLERDLKELRNAVRGVYGVKP